MRMKNETTATVAAHSPYSNDTTKTQQAQFVTMVSHLIVYITTRPPVQLCAYQAVKLFSKRFGFETFNRKLSL